VEFNILVTFTFEGFSINLIAELFTHFPVLFVEKIYVPYGFNAVSSVILIENLVICPALVLFILIKEYIGEIPSSSCSESFISFSESEGHFPNKALKKEHS